MNELAFSASAPKLPGGRLPAFFEHADQHVQALRGIIYDEKCPTAWRLGLPFVKLL